MADQDPPLLAFETQAAWAAWLDKHAATATDVWIRFAKKGSGVTSLTYPEAVETALCYGWIDGQGGSIDAAYSRQRFTPRAKRSRWSQLNCARAEALIAAGRMRPGGLAEVERAKADGRWAAAYAPPSTITVPDDLQQALEARPEARRHFERLNAKNRYAVLYRIADAKRPETRARRIAGLVDMLAEGRQIYP
jgi:uncharacterized protein YdeI (YjbR/CyaY-like superfamily)